MGVLQTDRQTDRQTNATENITTAHSQVADRRMLQDNGIKSDAFGSEN